MARSKPNRRSRRLSSKSHAALPSSATIGHAGSSNRVHSQPTSTRVHRHRVNGRYAAHGPSLSSVPYQYTPLNEEVNEIRLMTLHEGDFMSEIKVSISTTVLTPDNPPTYEALSYVWGSQKNPLDVKVGSHTITVTRNLAEALRHLRYKDRPRQLWIDAICVNQQDLEERAHQVKRMADIFRLADRVVVWLGPEKDDSHLAIKILEDLTSHIEVDWSTLQMVPASQDSESHWSERTRALPYTNEELLATKELLCRPWFERLWVQQEICLANSHAIVMCGVDVIAWVSLRKAIFCLLRKRLPSGFLSPDLQNLAGRVAVLSSGRTMNLLEAMQQTGRCKCLDPRDRVYAILSLLDEPNKAIGIEPDYSKAVSQVYLDVALLHIAQYKRINILNFSGLKAKSSGMPTWVPDWRVPIWNPRNWNASASGSSVSKVQYKAGGVLMVLGTCLATVQKSGRTKNSDPHSLIAEIQRLAPNNILRSLYVGGGSLISAYCHTLCLNRFAELYLPLRKEYSHAQQSLSFLSGILKDEKYRVPDYSPGTEGYKFLATAYWCIDERAFIETREGYIGLAPPKALPGDQVCILLGCDAPLLLRQTPNRQFRVVGACYVHGLGSGEGLLGPLPDHYQAVSEPNRNDSRNYWKFLDHRTGKTQVNDPRLGSPPSDDADPDLTPETIEKRGVKLQTFDLI